MNHKEEIEFAKRVDNDDRCKVKFYECVKYEGCPINRWSFHFDEEGVDYSDGRTSLTASIHDYLVYSSQRIKELEAQLVLKQVNNNNSDETLCVDSASQAIGLAMLCLERIDYETNGAWSQEDKNG